MKMAALFLTLAACALHAQPTPPSFEVASIRPHEGPLQRIGDFAISGARVTYGGYNPILLVMEAYNLKRFQVDIGAPKLPLDDFYEVAAVAPGTFVTRDQSRVMLQSLLATRFRLQFHREPREIAVYELVVDRNGPSLKPGTGDSPCFVRLGPVQPNDRNYRYQFTNCPIDRLANTIQADRPILDKTGLTGLHDIVFFATPDRTLHDSSDPGDISIRDAVRKFGLRLDATKAPIEMLVIDHIEKPSEN